MEGRKNEGNKWQVVMGPFAALLIIASSVVSCDAASAVAGTKERMEELVSTYQKERRRKTIVKKAKWIDETCTEYQVCVAQNPGESEADWCERFNRIVATEQALHPPVNK